MDYLSFLTLRLENCPKYPELERQDYMVLNSVANVSKALYPLGSYERIHCSLTMTVQGWKHSNKSVWNTAGTYTSVMLRRHTADARTWTNTYRNRLKETGKFNLQRGAQPTTEKEKRLSVIAHYNYTLRLRSCGLSRGAYGSRLTNPAKAVSPMQPDQRVTLSLETPLRSYTPKNPSAKASKASIVKQ